MLHLSKVVSSRNMTQIAQARDTGRICLQGDQSIEKSVLGSSLATQKRAQIGHLAAFTVCQLVTASIVDELSVLLVES